MGSPSARLARPHRLSFSMSDASPSATSFSLPPPTTPQATCLALEDESSSILSDAPSNISEFAPPDFVCAPTPVATYCSSGPSSPDHTDHSATQSNTAPGSKTGSQTTSTTTIKPATRPTTNGSGVGPGRKQAPGQLDLKNTRPGPNCWGAGSSPLWDPTRPYGQPSYLKL